MARQQGKCNIKSNKVHFPAVRRIYLSGVGVVKYDFIAPLRASFDKFYISFTERFIVY